MINVVSCDIINYCEGFYYNSWRLVSALVGEIAYEVVRFVIMLALLVLAVFVGGKLRKAADAKKAAKMAASENKEKEITE